MLLKHILMAYGNFSLILSAATLVVLQNGANKKINVKTEFKAVSRLTCKSNNHKGKTSSYLANTKSENTLIHAHIFF